MKTPSNYSAAQQELQQILSDLQTPDSSLEELMQKVERAKFLLNWAQEKLRGTEKELTVLFSEEAE